MEQTEEIIKAIELANNGGWMPILTIGTVFSLVITLLLVIWKMTQKANDKSHEASTERHEANEMLIKQNSNTSQTMSLLLVKLETNQENQQKEIDKILK